MKKKLTAKQRSELEEQFRSALQSMSHTAQGIGKMIQKVVEEHRNTIVHSFGNDPGNNVHRWDPLTQDDFWSLTTDETTEEKIIELYYSAAAREEYKRRKRVVEARKKAEKEALKPIHRDILLPEYLKHNGFLSPEQIKQLADTIGTSYNSLKNSYVRHESRFRGIYEKTKNKK